MGSNAYSQVFCLIFLSRGGVWFSLAFFITISLQEPGILSLPPRTRCQPMFWAYAHSFSTVVLSDSLFGLEKGFDSLHTAYEVGVGLSPSRLLVVSLS